MVLGLRTTTHAFNGLKGKYAFFNYSNKDKDFVGGFGRQILGETWNPKLGAGHYGSNHKFATAMNAVPGQESHPVMRGVKELRVKECDRIDAMARGLRACGVTVEEDEDTMIVHGMGPGGVPGGATCESFLRW